MIKDQQQDQFEYSPEYFKSDGVNDYSMHLKEDKKNELYECVINVKNFSQWLHWFGYSPVCVIKWNFK